MPEVRGRSREDPMPKGRWPRGATPRLRSGAAAERSNPTPEDRGRSPEDPMPKGRRPRGATPRPRTGVAAERNNPTSKE